MNYYEHHIGDYAKDAGHLSMLEDGAYRRLLDAYYGREKALPPTVKDCCKLARATTKPERDAVAYVLEEFFELRNDGYHQKRADEEIARFQDKQDKARRSANARWNKAATHSEGNANASPDAMRTHSEGNAPRARPQTPDTRPKAKNLPSPRAETSRSARAEPDPGLPPGTDPDAWAAYVAHHRQLGRWSAAREHSARGELRAATAQGADPTALLRWAVSRGLSALLDCHRRMQADAAKAAADDRAPGESLADASYRRSTGAQRQPVAAGALAAALLGHDPGDDQP